MVSVLFHLATLFLLPLVSTSELLLVCKGAQISIAQPERTVDSFITEQTIFPNLKAFYSRSFFWVRFLYLLLTWAITTFWLLYALLKLVALVLKLFRREFVLLPVRPSYG